MDNVTKKYYLVSYVAETKDGEIVTETVPMATIRNAERDIRKDRSIKTIQAITFESVVGSMPLVRFHDSSTVTKIGE